MQSTGCRFEVGCIRSNLFGGAMQTQPLSSFVCIFLLLHVYDILLQRRLGS